MLSSRHATHHIPLFEITVADVKAVWTRYFNDAEWTKPDEEQKTEGKPGLKGKVITVTEKIKTMADTVKRNSRWAITPFTPEILFCKELHDAYFVTPDNKLPFDAQLRVIELLQKAKTPIDSPAYRAVQPLKDKIANRGTWKTIAALIVQLKIDKFITPAVLSAIIYRSEYITIERFTVIRDMIRELQVEKPANAEDVSILIPLPKADIIAAIVREIYAAGCANPLVFSSITNQAERAEELANPFHSLRSNEKRKRAFKHVIVEIHDSKLTDLHCIFDILKNDKHYDDIAQVLSELRNKEIDVTELTRLVSAMIKKPDYLWDFTDGILILHDVKLDTPENIAALITCDRRASEVIDAVIALYAMQITIQPPQLFCTQENYNYLIQYPQNAYKVATVVSSLFHAKLATPENIGLIIKKFSQHAWDIAEVINELNNAEIATQLNFEKVCQHVHLAENLAKELQRLKQAKEPIYQHTFDLLVEKILNQYEIDKTLYAYKNMFFLETKAEKKECALSCLEQTTEPRP